MRKSIPLILGSLILTTAFATSALSAADPVAPIDAKAMYAATCAGCHGADGSKGLKDRSSGSVMNALYGYKAKTFGGAKKEIMEARAGKLSSAEIQALADFVASF
jgi:cytochrome c553